MHQIILGRLYTSWPWPDSIPESQITMLESQCLNLKIMCFFSLFLSNFGKCGCKHAFFRILISQFLESDKRGSHSTYIVHREADVFVSHGQEVWKKKKKCHVKLSPFAGQGLPCLLSLLNLQLFVFSEGPPNGNVCPTGTACVSFGGPVSLCSSKGLWLVVFV